MNPFVKHLEEVRAGGFPVLRWKTRLLLEKCFIYRYSLINSIWAIPAVLLIRCLRPWRLIRFGDIRSERIGHFAADAGHQWARRQQQSGKILDYYWIQRPTCNQFWEQMVCRNFPVHSWVRHLDLWNRVMPGGAVHHRPSSTTGSRDIQGCLEQMQEPMQFLPEEDADARSWLQKQGWREGEPFVCLLVRDSHYLNNDSILKEWSKNSHPVYGNGWDYHNYRDSDISTYVKAAEWLADQGIWVFRMGKNMEKPISSTHPRIIDYAFHPDRSDFLDIWLFAHCDLCISTGTGPDMISDVYRRPLLFLNYLPLSHIVSWSDAMHLPKTLVWDETGIPLTLTEYLEHSYLFSEKYEQLGIRIIDRTEDEILTAVQERWQRIEGTLVDTEDDMVHQQRFWDVMKMHPDFEKYNGWIHPEARAAAVWLRVMEDEFFG